ncbi:uncharacterized protein F54H12.2-like [Saccoglossus kowalevskii]
MAFVHEHSCECAKTELYLFTITPTQTSIEKESYEEVNPLTNIADGPIEFVISSARSDYIDIGSTLLHIKAKIKNANGGNLAAEATVGPTNLWLHSLFNQIDVYLNGKKISDASPTYSYRAMIETLLNYGGGAKSMQISAAIFEKDTAGKINVANPRAEDGDANMGLKDGRHDRTNTQRHIFSTKVFTQWGGISCPKGDHPVSGFQCVFQWIQRNQSIQLPEFGITSLVLNVGGEQVPAKPLKTDFTADGGRSCIMAYYTLFTSTNKIGQDQGNGITQDEYPEGYTIFAFDLTPDESASDYHLNLIQEGKIGLEIQFRQASTETVSVLIYAEYDNVIEIDRDRNVLTDF